MKEHTFLIVLTAAGSGLGWWPAAIEPSIDFPRWILLIAIALITGLATILSNGRWSHVVMASVMGVFAGLWTALVLFPPSDLLARTYALVGVAVVMVAALLVSLCAGLAVRNLKLSRKSAVAWCLPSCAVWRLGLSPSR